VACTACNARAVDFYKGQSTPLLEAPPEDLKSVDFVPIIGLFGVVLAMIWMSRPGGALAGLSSEEDAIEAMDIAESALNAVSGCRQRSLTALQDAERELGKAGVLLKDTEPDVRRLLQQRRAGLTRRASQGNKMVARCITR
jgi:hypothetical protein